MSINFQEILKELEYRVNTGIIDLTKEEQVTKLVEILRENKVNDANEIAQKVRVYFSYLNEAGPKKMNAPKKEEPEAIKGSFPAYSKDADRIVVFKNKNNFDDAISSGKYSKPTPQQIKAQAEKDKLDGQGEDDTETPTGKPGEKPEQPVSNISPDEFRNDAERNLEKEKKDKSKLDKNGKFIHLEDDDAVDVDGEEMSVADARELDDDTVYSALLKTKAEKAAEDAETSGEKKGVGAGSPESRAGECAVTYGGKQITKLMQEGASYDQAKSKVMKQLRNAVVKNGDDDDTFLTDAWVDSAESVLDYIEDSIGFENIKEFVWDTPAGRAIVDTEGHGTSSDCFVLTNDGSRVGISLKKDLSVFVFNGGLKSMIGSLKEEGMKISDTSTAEHYMNRRTEEFKKLAKAITTNEKVKKEFCNEFNKTKKDPSSTFGKNGNGRAQSIINAVYEKPGRGEVDNRPNVKKSGAAKALSDVNCNDVINHVVNGELNGDNMKLIADMAKVSNSEKLRGGYDGLRGLDREMTNSITKDFLDPKNRESLINLVKKETHIDDILFPDNPKLDELKVIYGESPAIEMKKANLVSLIGIKKEYAEWENAKTAAEKTRLRKILDQKINDAVQVTDKGGVMSVGINVGDNNIIPVFDAKVRTRGIGAAPTFEMSQSRFGGLAFKHGTTDFEKWDDFDREDAVTSMAKDLLDDLENLDLNDAQTKKEVWTRISKLNTILPEGAKNRSLKAVYTAVKES
jgi:hypothetical protein